MALLNVAILKNLTSKFILGLDSVQLISFLIRPRTLTEVAEHFGITLEEAEQSIRQAVESGRVVVAAKGSESSPTTSDRLAETRLFPRSLSSMKETKRLPKIQPRRISESNISSRFDRLQLRFMDGSPKKIRKTPPSPNMAEIFRARRRDDLPPASRVSLSLEKRLLDFLVECPKSITDLRGALGVSKGNVERLERKGLVESFWGAKGVGKQFRITGMGLSELMRLRSASRLDQRLAKKHLVSMRRAVSISSF